MWEASSLYEVLPVPGHLAVLLTEVALLCLANAVGFMPIFVMLGEGFLLFPYGRYRGVKGLTYESFFQEAFILAVIRDDHVIEEPDTEELCALGDSVSNLNVITARIRVTGRMIVLCEVASYVV